jgi:hypothetical protein
LLNAYHLPDIKDRYRSSLSPSVVVLIVIVVIVSSPAISLTSSGVRFLSICLHQMQPQQVHRKIYVSAGKQRI